MGPYTLYPIREDTKDKLKKIMCTHPPVREIYPGKSQNEYSIPIPTIHATSAILDKFSKVQKNEQESYEIIKLGKDEISENPKKDTLLEESEVSLSNEMIEKDVLGGSKVSYIGEADISPQIIDTGLEIPT
jgi:hypothetical protein